MPRRNRRPRVGHGLQDGEQTGFKEGGRCRNRTNNCRHPEIKKKRN